MGHEVPTPTEYQNLLSVFRAACLSSDGSKCSVFLLQDLGVNLLTITRGAVYQVASPPPRPRLIIHSTAPIATFRFVEDDVDVCVFSCF